MIDTTYNGWTNYETWNYKLWMDNDEDSYNYWNERAQTAWDTAIPRDNGQTKRDDARNYLATLLKSNCEDELFIWMPSQLGPFADMINASVSLINWHEIADNLLNDVDKSNEDPA